MEVQIKRALLVVKLEKRIKNCVDEIYYSEIWFMVELQIALQGSLAKESFANNIGYCE
jgi:hypothetical protein